MLSFLFWRNGNRSNQITKVAFFSKFSAKFQHCICQQGFSLRVTRSFFLASNFWHSVDHTEFSSGSWNRKVTEVIQYYIEMSEMSVHLKCYRVCNAWCTGALNLFKLPTMCLKNIVQIWDRALIVRNDLWSKETKHCQSLTFSFASSPEKRLSPCF